MGRKVGLLITRLGKPDIHVSDESYMVNSVSDNNQP